MGKVLNVAEKPSVAKEIVRHLAGGSRVDRLHSHSKFNPVNSFPFNIFGRQCTMIVTSVTGHLMGLEFPANTRSWQAYPTRQLFDAPVEKKISRASGGENIAKTLRDYARQASHLVLWLDCDREGENIAFEVVSVCCEANRSLGIYRAQFSAVTKFDLERACRNLSQPNKNLSDAVDIRQEVDLRIGAAFTRLLTLRYKTTLGIGAKQVISYGPCQFPTLGFVVDRFLEVKRFRREPFWTIKVVIEKDNAVSPPAPSTSLPPGTAAAPSTVKAEFCWDRIRLFDRSITLALFEMCVADPTALVTNVVGEPKKKWRPVPLATVEMTKLASRKLHMASAKCMEVAEKLYQRGFISYPRTETDSFSSTIPLMPLVEEQTAHAEWGAYASRLAAGEFLQPRAGSHDDKAHPPIHPVKLANRHELNDDHECRLYELVVRHFLACCSRDAEGFQTRVHIDIAGEGFHATGLIVTRRNFLDVYYPYETWSGSQLPNFLLWERCAVKSLLMNDGSTEPPTLLTEADLIDLMDRKGVGTDATMHEHIKTIQERNYAEKVDRVFKPTDLGCALVCGFREICAFQGELDISKPALRAKMEKDMGDVARGLRPKEDVLRATNDSMRRVFLSMSQNMCILDTVIRGLTTASS